MSGGDWTRGDSRVLPLPHSQPEGHQVAPASACGWTFYILRTEDLAAGRVSEGDWTRGDSRVLPLPHSTLEFLHSR